MRFTCPSCNESYKVADDLAGKTIRCRECNEWSRVSAPKQSQPRHSPVSRAPKVEVRCLNCKGYFMTERYTHPACPYCGETYRGPESNPGELLLGGLVLALFAISGILFVLNLLGSPQPKQDEGQGVTSPLKKQEQEEMDAVFILTCQQLRKERPWLSEEEIQREARAATIRAYRK